MLIICLLPIFVPMKRVWVNYSETGSFLYKFRDDKVKNMKELLADKDVLNIIQILQSKKNVVIEICLTLG